MSPVYATLVLPPASLAVIVRFWLVPAVWVAEPVMTSLVAALEATLSMPVVFVGKCVLSTCAACARCPHVPDACWPCRRTARPRSTSCPLGIPKLAAGVPMNVQLPAALIAFAAGCSCPGRRRRRSGR